MNLESKFPWAIEMCLEMFSEFGRTYSVKSPQVEFPGQKLGDEQQTYQTFEMLGVFDDSLQGRSDGYQRSDYCRIYLVSQNPNNTPKPGDVLTDVTGREYIIDNVDTIRPDGVAILHDCSISDG